MCRTMGKTNNDEKISPQSILSSSFKTISVLDDVHSLGDATVTTAASSSSSVTFGTASSVSINLDCTRIYLIDSIPEMLSKEELKEIWYSPEECQYMKEQEQFGDEADDDEVVHDGDIGDSVRVENADPSRRLTSFVKKKEHSNSRKKNRTKKMSYASPIVASSSSSSPSTPRSMSSCSSLISHIPTTSTAGSNIKTLCSQRHRRRSVRRLNRRRAWHAVLDEQRRQQDVGMDDTELLATIYRGYNIASVQIARKQAQRDTMAARRIYADSPEWSSPSSTNTVPPPTASDVAPTVASAVAHAALTQHKQQRQVPLQPQRSAAPSVGGDDTTDPFSLQKKVRRGQDQKKQKYRNMKKERSLATSLRFFQL